MSPQCAVTQSQQNVPFRAMQPFLPPGGPPKFGITTGGPLARRCGSPITRDRLQNEFLRLHEVERKTVIFVTHDIDEAIKLGDRIAIFKEGGHLAQYDTPDAILAAPADEFVARFVGADRGLKRLALRRLSEIELDAPNGVVDGPRTSLQTTLRDALSLMLTEGAESLLVGVGDGAGVGRPCAAPGLRAVAA